MKKGFATKDFLGLKKYFFLNLLIIFFLHIFKNINIMSITIQAKVNTKNQSSFELMLNKIIIIMIKIYSFKYVHIYILVIFGVRRIRTQDSYLITRNFTN